jgi:hypothetical protein
LVWLLARRKEDEAKEERETTHLPNVVWVYLVCCCGPGTPAPLRCSSAFFFVSSLEEARGNECVKRKKGRNSIHMGGKKKDKENNRMEIR